MRQRPFLRQGHGAIIRSYPGNWSVDKSYSIQQLCGHFVAQCVAGSCGLGRLLSLCMRIDTDSAL